MKEAVLVFALMLSISARATVVEIEESPANKVIAVFEEMQEQEEEVGSTQDNGWIHDFEDDHLGQEMDHLTTVKKSAITESDFALQD